MNPDEYAAMAMVEKDHWFYRGKRIFVRAWIRRMMPASQGKVLLDCGCGTGIFASAMEDIFQVIGMDDHEEALSYARKNLVRGNCIQGSATQIPMDDATVDVITLLDVLEHIPDDRKTLAEIYRVLKPKGLLILTVPASPALWSEWDEVLHHCRRYLIKDLMEKVRSAGMQVEHWNHTNILPYPMIFLIRKWQSALSGFSRKKRMEDRIPPSPINALLEWQFVRLACQKTIRFPFGVSLLLIAKKP